MVYMSHEIKSMYQEDTEAIKEHSVRLGRIIDPNNEKAALEQVVNKLVQLTKFQKVILLSCLKRYKDIFNGNIGEWAGPPVDTPLKYKAKPYHEQYLPIPVIHI